MKIVIAGKNNIAVECTKWLLSTQVINRSDLLVIFNKNDNGLGTFQQSFKKYSEENKLTSVSLQDIYKMKDLLFFSLEYDQIIEPSKFSSNRLFNIHFSLLPKYRGMYTSAWPILNDEKYSGTTLHEIDTGIDTGKIIDQQKFLIDTQDTSRNLYLKYINSGISIFKENFNTLKENQYKSEMQNEKKASYYSKFSIDYNNLVINLNETSHNICNQIRAFNFKEFQIPTIYNNEIKTSEALLSTSNEKAGTLINNTDKFIDIATLDYDLRLYKA